MCVRTHTTTLRGVRVACVSGAYQRRRNFLINVISSSFCVVSSVSDKHVINSDSGGVAYVFNEKLCSMIPVLLYLLLVRTVWCRWCSFVSKTIPRRVSRLARPFLSGNYSSSLNLSSNPRPRLTYTTAVLPFPNAPCSPAAQLK